MTKSKLDTRLIGSVAVGGGLGVIVTDMAGDWFLNEDVPPDEQKAWVSPIISAGLGILALVVVGRSMGTYAFAGAAVGRAVADVVDLVRN